MAVAMAVVVVVVVPAVMTAAVSPLVLPLLMAMMISEAKLLMLFVAVLGCELCLAGCVNARRMAVASAIAGANA